MPPDPDLVNLPLRQYAPRPMVSAEAADVTGPSVPVVDIHNHLGRWLSAPDWMVGDVAELLDVMDAVGIETIVNLDGRWGAELQANLDRLDRAHPGRFVTFCHLDWDLLLHDDASDRLVDHLQRCLDGGARGVKVWKDLGLRVRDGAGDLVLPDDGRLREAFGLAGAAGVPVLIHTADPKAFFEPLDRHNERLEELIENPDWWFGAPDLPSFADLLAALDRLLTACPATTFIGAHVGNAAEDLALVDRMLSTHENYVIDLGGRMAELGRQPRAAKRLIERHADRVLFGSDAFPVTTGDYQLWTRFLETTDECFDYSPHDEVPPQGRWQVSGLGLGPELLSAVWAGNARRVLDLPS